MEPKFPEYKKCADNCRTITFGQKCDCGAHEYNLAINDCKLAYEQSKGDEGDFIPITGKYLKPEERNKISKELDNNFNQYTDKKTIELELREALIKIKNGDYDNAHSPEGAALVAEQVLAKTKDGLRYHDEGDLREALEVLFDACQNLLPFKGSIKIYDSVDNANTLYKAMEKVEQLLAKTKGGSA